MERTLKRKLEDSEHESDDCADASNVDLLAENRKLRERVQQLEKELAALRSQSKVQTDSSSCALEVPTKDLDSQVSTMQKIVVKGIKSQMKWKQACKKGTAQWSWDGVTNFPVLLAFLKLDAKTPLFAMKKLSVEAFQSNVLETHITQSIRYDSLQITGDNVIVRFDSSTGEVKISGKYGL